jgi:transcriptional regulator with XRE-family HTH domain
MQLASFGQRLKELRVELGLTQDQLVIAFKAKFPDVRLDKSKISRYERGETKPARFEVVECLSYFFGVTPGYLMGRSKHRRATPYRRIPVLAEYKPGKLLQVQEDVSRYEYVEEGDAVDFGLVSPVAVPSARITPGDTIYLDLDAAPQNGDLVLTVTDDQPALVRYYEADGSMILKAEGSGHDVVVSKKEAEEVQIVGRAVYFKGAVK